MRCGLEVSKRAPESLGPCKLVRPTKNDGSNWSFLDGFRKRSPTMYLKMPDGDYYQGCGFSAARVAELVFLVTAHRIDSLSWSVARVRVANEAGTEHRQG